MKTELLQNIVAEWLTETNIPSLIPRLNPNIKLEELESILAVVGPRRAGKTYFMFQLIKELIDNGVAKKDEILFVDFEDFRLKDFSIEEIDELLVSFVKLTGKAPSYLFFDEIQNVSGWSRLLRTLHNKRKFKIIVSGSNSSLLSREISSELRGRYTDEMIFPFSFQEFLSFKNIHFNEITLHTPRRGEILAAFDEYLQYGGYPEVTSKTNPADKRKLLQNYYDTIFHRDIIERHGIKAEHILDKLMRSILENYSEQFSISRFEKQLKSAGLHGSKRTLANYLKFLEDAFFVLKSEKFSYSVRIRTMNPCKMYLIDEGFSFLGSSFSENKGKLLENVVARELVRRGFQLFYFKGKHECDFIVKSGLKPEGAIQVCWELNQKNEKREINGLLEATKELGLKNLMILTYNHENTLIYNAKEIQLLPVWKWLLSTNYLQN